MTIIVIQEGVIVIPLLGSRPEANLYNVIATFSAATEITVNVIYFC